MNNCDLFEVFWTISNHFLGLSLSILVYLGLISKFEQCVVIVENAYTNRTLDLKATKVGSNGNLKIKAYETDDSGLETEMEKG